MTHKQWCGHFLRSFFLGGIATPLELLRNDYFCELVIQEATRHEREKTWLRELLLIPDVDATKNH